MLFMHGPLVSFSWSFLQCAGGSNAVECEKLLPFHSTGDRPVALLLPKGRPSTPSLAKASIAPMPIADFFSHMNETIRDALSYACTAQPDKLELRIVLCFSPSPCLLCSTRCGTSSFRKYRRFSFIRSSDVLKAFLIQKILQPLYSSLVSIP